MSNYVDSKGRTIDVDEVQAVLNSEREHIAKLEQELISAGELHLADETTIRQLERELAAMTQDRDFAVVASGIARRMAARLQTELAAEKVARVEAELDATNARNSLHVEREARKKAEQALCVQVDGNARLITRVVDAELGRAELAAILESMGHLKTCVLSRCNCVQLRTKAILAEHDAKVLETLWDQESVGCDNCGCRLLIRPGSIPHNGLSEAKGEDLSLCGRCMQLDSDAHDKELVSQRDKEVADTISSACALVTAKDAEIAALQYRILSMGKGIGASTTVREALQKLAQDLYRAVQGVR